MGHTTRQWTLLASILFTPGCYNYVTTTSVPPAGRDVRAEIRDEGAALLTPQLGPGVLEVEGLLLSADSRGVSILVSSYITRRQGMLGGGDAVLLQPEHIGVLKEKRLDRFRSVLLGLSLAATTLLAIEVFGPDRRILENEKPDDPGPPAVRSGRPIGVRVPLGFKRIP
ncbi:MAG: hypothetical protein WEE89_14155 [Gemmatimonadota bacterium]